MQALEPADALVSHQDSRFQRRAFGDCRDQRRAGANQLARGNMHPRDLPLDLAAVLGDAAIVLQSLDQILRILDFLVETGNLFFGLGNRPFDFFARLEIRVFVEFGLRRGQRDIDCENLRVHIVHDFLGLVEPLLRILVFGQRDVVIVVQDLLARELFARQFQLVLAAFQRARGRVYLLGNLLDPAAQNYFLGTDISLDIVEFQAQLGQTVLCQGLLLVEELLFRAAGCASSFLHIDQRCADIYNLTLSYIDVGNQSASYRLGNR